MKTALSLFSFLTLTILSQTSYAALTAYDSFAVAEGGADYTIGPLFNQNPTVGLSGFTGAWSNNSTNDLRAEGGGLNSSLTTGALAGQLTTFSNTADRALYRQLTTAPMGSFNFSFLFNSVYGNDAGFGLANSTGLSTVPEGTQGVLLGVDGQDIVVWVDGVKTTVMSNYDENTTYVGVVSVLEDAGGVDSITASVYDANSEIPSLLATSGPIAGEISGNLTHLGFVKDANVGTGLKVDEFRLGTLLTDVIAPEPASAAVWGLLIGAVCIFRRRKT